MEALLPLVAWTFATLDRTTGQAHVSADLDTVITNTSDHDGSYVDIVSNRLALYGELPLGGGFGLVASLPLIYLRGLYDGDPEFNYGVFGFGAFSIGGSYDAYAGEVGGGRLTVRPRLDLVLPTGNFEGDVDPSRAREVIAYHRAAEPADDSGSEWVRGGVTGRYRRGPWAAQVDLLVKYAFDERIEGGRSKGQVPYLSVGLGLGRELAGLRATAELVVVNLRRDDPSLEDKMLATGVVSLGGHLGAVELRGHFGVPLNEYLRTHVLIFGLSVARPL